MQIVRSLGGYTLGRSDLVRRAMSKKKAAVMEKERQNFVYGMKKREFQAVSTEASQKRWQIRSMMR